MRVIGIDPGISGAVALVTMQSRYVDVHDMPTMLANKEGSKQQINVAELARILRSMLADNPDVRAIMERVTAMPSQKPGPNGARVGMGATSAFMFGKSVAHVEATLITLGIPLEFVTPGQWKRALNLPGGKDKEAARALAQQCFPEAPLGLKKHHGRAEALLVAKWYADKQRAHPSGEPF